MKIAILAPTIAPLTSVGGLGDVMQDLPKFLKDAGNEVITITFNHENKISSLPHEKKRTLGIKYQGTEIKFDVIETKHPFTGVKIVAFSNEEFNQLDTWDPIKYEVFADLVVDYLSEFDDIDCISGHDWPCGLAIAKCHEKLDIPTTITIHNEAFKGPIVEYKGHVMTFLELGIYFSDAFNTVSPTHAEEIKSIDFIKEQSKTKPFHGIINGIDLNSYDPIHIVDKMLKLTDGKLNPRMYGFVRGYSAEDAHVVKPKIKLSWFYNSKNLKNYIENWNNMDKSAISGTDVEVYGDLSGDIEIPLIGFVGRGTYQKGFSIMFEAFPEILEEYDIRIVMLSKGECDIEEGMKDLAESYSGKVISLIGYCPPLASLIFAGSDWTVIPSVWEPCGLVQMESMAYCTPVIAREVGGLKDTIIPLHYDPYNNPNFDVATGVLFKHYDKYGLKWGIEHAITWTFYKLKDICLFIRYKQTECPESPYDKQAPLSIMMKNCYHHTVKNLSWQNNDSVNKYKAIFGGSIYHHYK
ncbi:glycogen synthase [Methanotorris formicicus]|uniref:Starch synthase n=1 Tax=Methanotorris formicicus Mc-S-70 TaxID=647171 RepID=H1KZ60_9EURY|nr:glycogen/starch synthase [Methanotorris formicicus]EHP86343.1 Starch synthase [Methanotorris formicicus Mc-S-70]